VKKKFCFAVPASSFYRDEEEKKKLEEEFFKTEFDEDQMIEVTTTLENLLWHLFTQLPVPTAPLKNKAHEAWLLKISEILTSTKEEEIPSVAKEDLEKVKKFLDEDELFEALTIPYDIKLLPDGESHSVTLPAINLVRDKEFINTVTELFA
jgi:hypothetical protein